MIDVKRSIVDGHFLNNWFTILDKMSILLEEFVPGRGICYDVPVTHQKLRPKREYQLLGPQKKSLILFLRRLLPDFSGKLEQSYCYIDCNNLFFQK